MRLNSRRQVAYAVLGIALTLAFFELVPADPWLQQFFRSSDGQSWVLDKYDPLTAGIFYTGIKRLLIGLAIALLCTLVISVFRPTLRPYRHRIGIVLLSLLLVPAVVGLLKNVTQIACPRDVSLFGGMDAYRPIMDSLLSPEGPHRCFPAGHASGGFALLSLCFAFRKPRRQWLALAAALTLGWTMGVYKMAIGDHFLSHTLVTMLLAWLVVNLLVVADTRLL